MKVSESLKEREEELAAQKKEAEEEFAKSKKLRQSLKDMEKQQADHVEAKKALEKKVSVEFEAKM